MLINILNRVFYSDNDAGGSNDNASDGRPIITEASQTVDTSKIQARLDALEQENQNLKKSLQEKDRDNKIKKAEKDGKLKDELDATSQRLADEQAKREALEKAVRDRINKNIERLPQEMQDDIALVKDDLPIHKLEALVDKRLDAVVKAPPKKDDGDNKPAKPMAGAPPMPGVHGDNKRDERGHELHPETVSVLRHQSVRKSVYDTAKFLGVDSNGVFGWQRGDDQTENKDAFMQLLRDTTYQPRGRPTEDGLLSRIIKKG